MASMPYPLGHDFTADLVGMARKPYPPTIYKDNFKLLLINNLDHLLICLFYI